MKTIHRARWYADHIIPKSLQEDLENFVLERNWLIHKSIMNEDETLSEYNKKRIRSICQKIQIPLESVEADIIQYSSSVGVDMSRVQAQLKQGG